MRLSVALNLSSLVLASCTTAPPAYGGGNDTTGDFTTQLQSDLGALERLFGAGDGLAVSPAMRERFEGLLSFVMCDLRKLMMDDSKEEKSRLKALCSRSLPPKPKYLAVNAVVQSNHHPEHQTLSHRHCSSYQQLGKFLLNDVFFEKAMLENDFFEVLSRFIGTNVEALATEYELQLSKLSILERMKEDQEGLWELEKVEGEEKTICARFDRQAKALSGLFEKMVADVTIILGKWGGEHHGAYLRLLVPLLDNSVKDVLANPIFSLLQKIEARPEWGGCATRLAVIEARLAIKICVSVWRLKCLVLNYKGLCHSLLFPKHLGLGSGLIEAPLISKDALARLDSDLFTTGDLEEMCGQIKRLQRWVGDLYARIELTKGVPGDLSAEQIESWIAKVENNLGTLLEVVDRKEDSCKICMLGQVIVPFGGIAADLEATLRILYGPERSAWRKKGLGSFLLKLEQLLGQAEDRQLGNVCSKNPTSSIILPVGQETTGQCGDDAPDDMRDMDVDCEIAGLLGKRQQGSASSPVGLSPKRAKTDSKKDEERD